MSTEPQIITFGCRLNAYESEIIQRNAIAAGLEDAVIINTCAVTAEAERQAKQSIRRLRRERPAARIIVTGCATEIDRAKFEAMPEVDCIIGNVGKTELEGFLSLQRHPRACGDPSSVQQKWMPASAGMTPKEKAGEGKVQRAFVEVQNGCDHRCTFCIIPYGRGASRSKTAEKIAEEVRARTEEGYREIVFTGVDIASYGGDLPNKPRLGEMIREVLKAVPESPWLRLSSIDPAAMDEDLWDLIADEPRLLPHLHLSIQAGDDMILKRMKRRHSRADVIRLCERARRLRPDIAFGADFIAGFPTETEAMFENTMCLAEECAITWLHVFPYSARTGTPAAKMPQVNGAVRRERAVRLRELGARASARHHEALIGKQFDVLVEQQGLGCTRQFAKVKLVDDAAVGEIVGVECVGCENGQAIARLV